MRIARALVDQIIAQARAEAPNECCGMIAARGDRLTAYFQAHNEFESPMRFRNSRVFMGGELRPPEFSRLTTDPEKISALRRELI